ncbi:hypothetical protein L1049_011130 [Liquidambar formosana]|uniref:Clp R domain-containing protein n=1 Tax=Liquidambar formosana TaxID=63359 RepID=A0AAP0RWW3_LIQFO
MPTPVSTARQCLTPEAAHALDEAVTVARRRGHAQTTSLHAVSALLSTTPSSSLREACGRARNLSYSPRLQFKALELCLSVSLDRVPSTQLAAGDDDPPVSNSLMAAIKRSQANQRRQPENFHLYQQIQQQSSMSCVKVELQHLILSILDDPLVSRVFGEAGFRSCDIKLAILRPLPHLLRYSRTRNPPMFLCNLTENSDPGRRSFSFPFSGFPWFFNGDENCRRIGEVLVRNKGRNPLLVGVCAHDALRSFIEMLQRRKDGVLPMELSGLNEICIEKDVSKFISENYKEEFMNSRFEEVGKMVEHCLGPGLVVNVGDLKPLIADDAASAEAANYVVTKLTRLLEIHGGKVWLMGTVAMYETYLKFLSRFPSIEKDWDLQLLPITSIRPSMGESFSRSSLMESFVPFGGFFSTPSDLKGPLSGSYRCASRCHLCNEKYEQEVTAVSKGGFSASVADQYQFSLPSWLQMTELGANKGLDAVKAKDDGMLLSARITGLQKKWNNICHRLHRTEPFPEADIHQVDSQVPAVEGFQFVEDRKENDDNYSSNNTYASPNGSGCKNVNSCMSMDLESISTSKPDVPFPMVSEPKNESLLSKLLEKSSRIKDLEPGDLRSPRSSFSNSSVGDGRTSPTSAASVTTDLGLGIFSAPTTKELKIPNQTHRELPKDNSLSFSANFESVNRSISNHQALSSSCSCPDFCGLFDPRDFKTLFRALTEKVGWQEEAISIISQKIACCRTRNENRHGASPRGDVWFNFLGPDRFGKKKIAVTLAEILYRSRENFIHLDLCSQDGMIHAKPIYDCQEMNGYNVKFRGKTAVDYIAGELSKKPLSIVFLENVDKADLLAQSSLSRAIRTGKFSDSHGREVSINNAIFVTTSGFTKGSKNLSSRKEITNCSEERILKAKGWPIQILVGCLDDNTRSCNLSVSVFTAKGISDPIFMNKRKLLSSNEILEQHETLEIAKRAHKASNMYLDLNLPAEENEVQETDNGNPDNDSVSENSKAWLEDFFDQVDETVFFKPFDFDALAQKVLKEISDSFHKIIGLECLLEIDSKVVEQVIAAACLSDRTRVVEDWVEQVLSRGFAETQKRYNLTAHSIVKLVTCEGHLLEEQEPCLPPRIILN